MKSIKYHKLSIKIEFSGDTSIVLYIIKNPADSNISIIRKNALQCFRDGSVLFMFQFVAGRNTYGNSNDIFNCPRDTLRAASGERETRPISVYQAAR